MRRHHCDITAASVAELDLAVGTVVNLVAKVAEVSIYRAGNYQHLY